MIQYHEARVPAYNGSKSESRANALALRDDITKIEGKAKARWEANH